MSTIEVVNENVFKEECMLQQYISTTTANDDKIAGLYTMACPYVLYMSQFSLQSNDTNICHKLLLDILKKKGEMRTAENKPWNDFYDILIKEPDITCGVIAMQLAIENAENTPLIRSPYIVIPVIYELLRIAIFCKILHGDLHKGNYFVEKIQSDLIYGRRVEKSTYNSEEMEFKAVIIAALLPLQ